MGGVCSPQYIVFQILTAAFLMAAMVNPWCARCELESETDAHWHEHHDCTAPLDHEDEDGEHHHASHDTPEMSVTPTAFKPSPGESECQAGFTGGVFAEIWGIANLFRPPDPPLSEIDPIGTAAISVAAKLGVFLI